MSTHASYLYAANYAIYMRLLQRCGMRNPTIHPLQIG